jgi:hypothetical protein
MDASSIMTSDNPRITNSEYFPGYIASFSYNNPSISLKSTLAVESSVSGVTEM